MKIPFFRHTGFNENKRVNSDLPSTIPLTKNCKTSYTL